MNLRTRFLKYRQAYVDLWTTMEIRPQFEGVIKSAAQNILDNKSRYQAVEAQTNVPWWMIGLIHKMEANCSFSKHLHNGDSLNKRTWRVPAGRPRGGRPPFTWEESAVDALIYDGLHKVGADGDGWDLESVAFYLEKFNGFGYRPRGIQSPYLWSGSKHYLRGKYVRDGVFDPLAQSQQTGCMPVLRYMMDVDPDIQLSVSGQPNPPEPIDENEVLDRAPESTLSKSRTLMGGVLASVGVFLSKIFEWTLGGATETASIFGEVARYGGQTFRDLSQIANWMGITPTSVGLIAAVVGLALVFHARVDAQRKAKIG